MSFFCRPNFLKISGIFFSFTFAFLAFLAFLSVHPSVYAVSGNLITTNPGFESNNLTGWEKTSGWSVQSSVVHSGSKAAMCTYNNGDCVGNLRTQGYSVTPGHTIQFNAWLYTTAASGNISLVPRWDGTTTYSDPTILMTTPNSWQKITINEVAPVNSTQFHLQIIPSNINGNYYIDDASVYDYGQDNLSMQFQDINDNQDPQVTSTVGWISGLNPGFSDWKDSPTTPQKIITIKIFSDNNNNGIREDSTDGYLQSDMLVTLEKCNTYNSNLKCTSWSGATKYTGYTDATGTATFHVTDDRDYRATLPPADGRTQNIQYDAVVQGTSALFELGFGGPHDFHGVLRSVSDATCNASVGSHPCYKIYPGEGYIWLTGSLGSYINHQIYVNAQNSQKASSGIYFYPSASYGSIFGYTIPDSPAIYGLGGGDIPQSTSDQSYDQFYKTTTSTNYISPKTLSPAIYWSVAEPDQSHKYYTNPTSYDAWNIIDAEMNYCNQLGISCPIYIGSAPQWAVQGANTKFGVSCSGYANGNPYPIDASSYQDLADLAAAVANRYSSVKTNTYFDPNTQTNVNLQTAKVSYIQIFNEPDGSYLSGSGLSNNNYNDGPFNSSGNPVCGLDPIYWATSTSQVSRKIGGGQQTLYSDLNNNSQDDYKDYVTLFTTIYQTVNSIAPIDFGRLTDDFGSPASQSFINNILTYQSTPGISPYDVMDLHYYDDQAPSWTDNIYGVKGIRQKIMAIQPLLKIPTKGPYGVPITFSEMGFYSQTQQDPIQANSVFKEFAQAYSTGSVIDLQWFLFSRPDTSSSIWPYTLRVSGTNRPSFYAYQTISKQLNDGTWRYLDRDYDTNVEGYTFGTSANSTLKEVLWIGRCQGTCPSTVAKTLTVVPSSTSTVYKTDGSTVSLPDTDGNGQVTYTLTTSNNTPDPVIIQYTAP